MKKKTTIDPKDPILTILPATKKDLDTVWAFECKLHAFHGTKGKKNMPAFLEELCVGPRSIGKAWIASLDKKPVGFLITLDLFNILKHKRSALILSLFIEEPYRGMGIARCLIAVAAREALARKCTSMTINARKMNKTANAIYKGLGFETAKKRPNDTNSYTADLKTVKKLTGSGKKKTG